MQIANLYLIERQKKSILLFIYVFLFILFNQADMGTYRYLPLHPGMLAHT